MKYPTPKALPLNRRCKGKCLLPLSAHRRLKNLNSALMYCNAINESLKRKLAKRIAVPSKLIKSNIVHLQNVNNG